MPGRNLRFVVTINLNIKLDADVRVKLEQQAKDDVATKPIF